MSEAAFQHIHLRQAPFLVWPVARREFYAAISAALALPLLWGALIFGWRALVVIGVTLAGAFVMHRVLKRWTNRGKELVTAHSVLSALTLAALSQALYRPWMMFLAGAGMVLLIWAFGREGRDRIHASLLVALLLAFFLTPERAQRREGAIVARDRLFMGDLSQSAPRGGRVWPRSVELSGQDAARVPRPHVMVVELWNEIARTAESAGAVAPSQPEQIQSKIEGEVDEALVLQLPTLEGILFGVAPGEIGTVSALWIVAGGLYLAYRNILRPRSCALFLAAAVGGLALSTLFVWGRGPILTAGLGGAWQYVGTEEMLTLLFYPLLNSDIFLAAVFLLALPGTEPITRRGRRWYVLLAGLTAGFLQRAELPVPAATLTILVFQLFCPTFDALLGEEIVVISGAMKNYAYGIDGDPWNWFAQGRKMSRFQAGVFNASRFA